MTIQHIKVRNFRSVRDVSIDATDLTVLVGCNDEGKSNILRALDLFFNSERKAGYDLRWERDFSAFAKTARNKAPQIEISLTFTLPTSFNVGGAVLWRKTWRAAGLYDEELALANGDPLPSRSKAYAYLKAVRYEYVPAIKGNEYFQRLLGSLHEMLDTTVQHDIRNAADKFTAEIRKHTKGILHDLEAKIGLKSEIALPSDLKTLFSELEFRSSIGGYPVALSQRGDGIKVRHIPVILRWLAEQANHMSAPGKPRVATIWGYEEPENNLETKRCFELADFFSENCNNIQTFLTTHSPVFYSVFSDKGLKQVSLLEVKLDQTEGTRLTSKSVSNVDDIGSLHSSIGFLDLIEPHVKEWRVQVGNLQKRLEEGVEDVPTIFVEGPSDKEILDAVFLKFFPEYTGFKVSCSTKNGGGHAWVKDSLIAWHYRRNENRAVGLFDGDEAANSSVKEFNAKVVNESAGSHKCVQYKIKADGYAKYIKAAGIPVPVSIEELCPAEIWWKASKSGWLENRPKLNSLYSFNEIDMTFNDWIKKRLPDKLLQLVAIKSPKDDAKKKISRLVAQSINDSEDYDFSALQHLAQTLLTKLNLKSS